MSLAIIIGVVCTALNFWLMYKQRKSYKDPAIEAGQSLQSNRTVTIDHAASGAGSTASMVGSTLHRPRKISVRGVSPAGFDNPNWVYGENGGSSNSGGSQGVLLHPEPENLSRPRPVSVSVISDGGRGGSSTTRYATIRRAPSILMALPPELHHNHFTHQTPSRPIHLKSASFRFGGERDPTTLRQSRAAAKVTRSKTMRETTFMTSSPCHNVKHPAMFETTTQHTFAQRFQSSLDGNSALSFVHDITGEEDEDEGNGGISVASTAPMADSSFAVDSPPPKIPIRSTKVENGMQTTIEADVMQQEDDDDDDDDEEEAPPARLPAVRHQVRSSDRIILRVESFRTMQSSPARTSTPPAPAVQRPHPVRNNTNVKRVSSSTQTELSVLKPTSGNNHNNFGSSPVGQGQQRMKRLALQQHQQYQSSNTIVKPSGGSTSQVTTETATMPQISPVESSSGYSSPRGTESKSPTPEPTIGSGQQNHQESSAPGTSTPAPVNVTVIQIDPNPTVANHNSKNNNNKEFQPRITDVTYAIPRKRSERGTPTGHNESTSTTPDQSFQVSIQSKPVSRSVSFHHMSQAGRKAVYGNEWLNASSLLGNHLPPLGVMSIPRPALRSNSHQRYTSPSGSSRRSSSVSNNNVSNAGVTQQHHHPSGSSLSRSTSMYLAMSEIQRKLDLLQVLDSRHHIAVSSGDVVPVHRESHYNNNNQHNYDEFYSANPSHHTNERDSSRRTRSRSNSSNRQQQQPPPQPPPPPPPPPPPLPSVDLNDSLDSAKTLAYLSELEMLARHWRTQLLYKVLQDSFILISSFHIYNFLIECIFSLLQQVELKSPNKRMMGTVLENDSFQC